MSRQLKIDELSMQQKENPCTVNQLTVQIQDLQDKVNSLNDAPTLENSESQTNDSPRFLPAA